MTAVLDDPDVVVKRLAATLGLKYEGVWRAVQRLKQDGWATKLLWVTCAHCGQPLISPPIQKRLFHPACLNAHSNALARERRKLIPPERKRALQSKRAASPSRRSQAETKRAAGRAYRHWTPREDSYLLENKGKSPALLAVELGRSYSSVSQRLRYLEAHAPSQFVPKDDLERRRRVRKEAVPSALGRAVRRLRQDLKISQRELAVRASCGRDLIVQLETGTSRYIRPTNVERIASALGIPDGDLWREIPGGGPDLEWVDLRS